MKIAILGFGKEGRSILKFLKKNRIYSGAEFWIVDKKTTTKKNLAGHEQFGKKYLKNLERFDIIFRSPGVPYNLPELVRARKAGVKFSSATKLFFEQIQRQKQKSGGVSRKPLTTNHYPLVIGITGTKGKGTVATLLYKILKAAGKRVFLAGNIGNPATDLIPKIGSSVRGHELFVVLELSSFQLQDLKISPQIAVVLDIFPDHQDKHKSLAEYYIAKASIAKHQKKGDKIFFLPDNKLSSWVARQSSAKKIPVNLKNFGLFGQKDLRMAGRHNYKNAAMAATVAKRLGVPEKTIVKIAKKFRGLPHRLQFVRRVLARPVRLAQGGHTHHKNKSAIYFYNDSAAVNPGATVAALEALSEDRGSRFTARKPKIILIAGGVERGLNYSGLAKAIRKYTVTVVLYGENRKTIAKAIKSQGSGVGGQGNPVVVFTKTLKEAIRMAYRHAKTPTTNHYPLITILFSPASASFDMFKNYEERGVDFIKIVKRIK